MANFLTDYLIPFAWILGGIILTVACLMGGMAYLTLFERKVLAKIQLRIGPNIVGPFGLLQPIADGLKLLTKETIIPSGANRAVFILAPMMTFILALTAWAVIPFNQYMVLANINVGVLFLFAISSLGVYGIIMAGWASNSKYAFLGSLRAAAQMVSYEVSMGLVLVTVLLCAGSLNLSQIVLAQSHGWFGVSWLPGWYVLPLAPMAVVFFVSGLAETNRSPFDLVEGESELVGGYFVEYSSMTFALFYLGEYMNMILVSAMTSILFLGGWLPPLNIEILNSPYLGPIWFVLKTIFVLFCFIWVRGSFPRFRYDQLMRLGWKIFLPLSLGYLLLVAFVLVYMGWLPKVA
ncbi:MAG: NADH-quinone oxidoreductase subunit NuoH [Rhodospirillales bacterium]|nr:NADH-quinone oxidoreductase subunit NuoH [Rhodospirillales bacterium]